MNKFHFLSITASFGNANGIPGGGPGSLLATMNVNGFQQHQVSTNPPPPLPQQLSGVQHLNVSQPGTQHIIAGHHHVQNSSDLVQNSTNIKLENGGSTGGNPAGVVASNPSYYACTSYSPPSSDPQQHQQQALLTANAYSKHSRSLSFTLLHSYLVLHVTFAILVAIDNSLLVFTSQIVSL